MPPRPAFDLAAAVDRMAVDNQKDFLLALPDEPPQKVDHDSGGESLLEHHEGQVPPVGYGRDQVAAEPLTRGRHDRGMPLDPIAASGLVIGTHAHLVAPVDLRLFPAGLAAYRRVVFFQPLADRLRVLFVGAAKRLLRGKAPVLQVAADRPDRNQDAVTIFDQPANRIAGPQGKGQFQLVGAAVGNQTNHCGGLMPHQTRAMFGAAFVGLQRRLAALAVRAEPVVDRGAADMKHAAGLALGHLLFGNRMNDPVSQFLLRLRGQQSSIVRLHTRPYDQTLELFNKLCSG